MGMGMGGAICFADTPGGGVHVGGLGVSILGAA
jgi:hypothetical protein